MEMSEFSLTSEAKERLEGGLAFFERVLNDALFREQLPDAAAIAILDHSGEASFPHREDGARILFNPDRGEATIFEGDRVRIVKSDAPIRK